MLLFRWIVAAVLIYGTSSRTSPIFTLPILDEVHPTDKDSRIKFSDDEIKRALDVARSLNRTRYRQLDTLEDKKLVSHSLTAHALVGMLKSDGSSTVERAKFAQDVINEMSQILYEKLMKYGTTKLPRISVPHLPDCEGESRSRYRNIDGECNNIKNGLWGTPFTAQRRLLAPQYGGLYMDPRQASENPRIISERLLPHGNDAKDDRLNAMAMQFGQFLNHDISSTPISTYYDDKTGKAKRIKCCEVEKEDLFEDCFPIRISHDWFYRKQKVNCLEFTRSAPAFNQRQGVFTYGPRQQMNQVTSFIDGSQIYGSSRKVRNELFDSKTGLMKTSVIHKRDNYLMQDSEAHCESRESHSCFKSGDHRVNTQLNLMMMHTLFMREHNRIAAYFQNHTKWSGKKTFEETRRIMGAILQHITFKEYLPAVLNPKMLKFYGLDIANRRTKYRSDVDPSIINEFSTAAFRFGHSQIYRKLLMAEPDGTPGARVKLTDSYFNPDQIYTKSTRMHQYILGLFHQRSLAADNQITSAVTTGLFAKKGKKYGLDLAAINIQRGRDHGIPTYAKYRALLKGSPDFTDVMSSRNITHLLEIYGSMENVDLFVGGLYEWPLQDSAIGVTFNHIIASQFRNLMLGDRYFYSHRNTHSAGFSQKQYEEIVKVSLASITCQNVETPYYTRIQTNGCLQSCPSYMVSCADVPKMNLKVFLRH